MKFVWSLLIVLLAACTNIPSPTERQMFADALAQERNWQSERLSTANFELLAYLPGKRPPSDDLTIYIEGDGFAWVSEDQPSSDPTPRDPLALRLALAQPKGNAAYLARPCQFVDAEAAGCSSRYWTEWRFSPEVIMATDRAIDILKGQFSATKLTLVGYSGGGTVAALVAARRMDVERLVTVAGNLDHRAWTTYHRIRPLAGSLNPADFVNALQTIPQWHFAGGKDANITPDLVNSFAGRFQNKQPPRVLVVPDFNHRCCWVEAWSTLWLQVTSRTTQ